MYPINTSPVVVMLALCPSMNFSAPSKVLSIRCALKFVKVDSLLGSQWNGWMFYGLPVAIWVTIAIMPLSSADVG